MRYSGFLGDELSVRLEPPDSFHSAHHLLVRIGLDAQQNDAGRFLLFNKNLKVGLMKTSTSIIFLDFTSCDQTCNFSNRMKRDNSFSRDRKYVFFFLSKPLFHFIRFGKLQVCIRLFFPLTQSKYKLWKLYSLWIEEFFSCYVDFICN